MSAIAESQTTRIPTNNGTGSNIISGNGQKVRLTYYDGYNLGCGLTKSSSKISQNSQGWYTYKDEKITNGQEYIIVATSTKELKRQSGWEKYNPPLIFQYYDIMFRKLYHFSQKEKWYNAIVANFVLPL